MISNDLDTVGLWPSGTPFGGGENLPLLLVTVAALDLLTISGLEHARAIPAGEVVGLHVQINAARTAELRTAWSDHPASRGLPLLVEDFRGSVEKSVRRVVVGITRLGVGGIVVVPQIVHERHWHRFIHNQTGRRIERALAAVPGITILVVPVPLPGH
jgi:hypothetical protein